MWLGNYFRIQSWPPLRHPRKFIKCLETLSNRCKVILYKSYCERFFLKQSLRIGLVYGLVASNENLCYFAKAFLFWGWSFHIFMCETNIFFLDFVHYIVPVIKLINMNWETNKSLLKVSWFRKGFLFFFNSPKKWTKNFGPSRLGQKLTFSSSFFGRIEGTKISFHD